MADERYLERLLAQFRRVGIDPDTFSAMLAVSPREALQALESLPDDAGPGAFLAELRRQGGPATGFSDRREAEQDHASGAA